jgi:hypothetical protein
MLIFLGCCAVPQAPARSFGCVPATTQHLPLSERHSAVTFLLNCASLPTQDDGHHTPILVPILSDSAADVGTLASQKNGPDDTENIGTKDAANTGASELALPVKFCRRDDPGAIPSPSILILDPVDEDHAIIF